MPTLTIASTSGCGCISGLNGQGALGTCSLRGRGPFAAGTYKFTLVTGAQFKDIYGTEYTQAADQSITVTIQEAPAAASCL